MAFQPHSSFDALASVIEQLGADGRTVRRAEAAAGDEDDALCATVDVAVPLSALASRDDGRVPLEPLDGAESREGFAFGIELPGIDGSDFDHDEATDLTVRPIEATLDAESVVATLEVVIGTADRGDRAVGDGRSPEPDPERGAGNESFRRGGGRGRDADGLAAARDESVPPYEDEAYLQRLYEACDTFAEMSDRIEMDVSAETVRRYMIDAGVHSPTSYELGGAGGEPEDRGTSRREPSAGDEAESGSANADATDADDAVKRGDGGDETDDTGADADVGEDADVDDAAASADASEDSRTDSLGRVPPESLPDEQLVADGIGLPDELTLPDVVKAVVDGRTVYDVQRDLGLAHDRTRQLLRQLNVLDLVLCRASEASRREVSIETVTGRIRQSAPDGA